MPKISLDEMHRRRNGNASALGSQALTGYPADVETVRLLDLYAEGELNLEDLSAALDNHAMDVARTSGSRTYETKIDENATRVIDPSSEARDLPELFWIVRSIVLEMRSTGFGTSADSLCDALSISSVPGEIIGATGFTASQLLDEGGWSESITSPLKSALAFTRTAYPRPYQG